MAAADASPRLTADFEGVLRRYALGQLDEEARSQVEEQLVTDPDAFEALGVVEDELIEEYLDGAATFDARSFEGRFLTSLRSRARLGCARALRAYAGRNQGLSATRRRRSATATASAVRQPAWLGLAAALVASLAGNLWLVARQRILSGPATPPASTRSVGPMVPAIEPPTPAAPPSDRRASLEHRSEPSGAGSRVRALEEELRHARAAVTTFSLAAGTLRSAGSVQQLELPREAIAVRLRLELAGDERGRYQAVVLDGEGEQIWAASKLAVEAEEGETVVVLVLPAGFLPRGDYQVRLDGSGERGEPERVATYAFRVSTR